MFLGSVGNSGGMTYHESRYVNLLPRDQEMSIAHVHAIRKVATLGPENDVLYDKPKQ